MAHQEMVSFLKWISAQDFFEQDHKGKSGYAMVIARLKLFLHCSHRITVHDLEEAQPGFASWLLKCGDGKGGIALYSKTMASWAGRSGMPLHVQKIRCIIHELGHIKTNPDLLNNTPAAKNAPYATAEDEETAWAFTGAFLGLMLGRYSKMIRATRLEDDAPKKFM